MYRVSTALCIDINSPSGKTENFQTALRGGREIVLEDSKVQQVSKKETTLVTQPTNTIPVTGLQLEVLRQRAANINTSPSTYSYAVSSWRSPSSSHGSP